ncbi:hypothetical protein N0V82_009556 [Gnomoniopsis sp. IMI 355080]|nr:hypothetical protein N0V82_009556 [Gnomoniopsis sp. IMI 355080]
MFSASGLYLESDQHTANQPLSEATAPASQPDAVKFLDNNLTGLHNALKHPMSQYNPLLRRYVGVSEIVREQDLDAIASSSTQPNMLAGNNGALTLIAQPMEFWDSIFRKSVDRFQALWLDAPKNREKSGWNYSVRDKSTWEDVYSQLQKAREYYDGDTKGLWGRYAKGYTKKRRWVVDHSGPVARQAVKFVPTMDYATPVIAAVQVLVDAFETTSRVRETMTKGLEKDDLEGKFANIERFLATFPKDAAVEEASVELIAATLKTIEDAIGFFLESNDTQQKLDMVLNGTAVSFIEQRETGTNVRDMTKKVTSVLEKLDKKEASDAFLRNTLLDLLIEAQKEKDRNLEEKQRLKG